MTVEPNPADSDDIPEPSIAGVLSRIPVDVTIRLARIRMPLADVTGLRVGSVLKFDRQVGEPVDLLVADRVVARGELVAVDGKLGIRVLEIAPDDVIGEKPE